ncbi:MAG: hypothetical protein EPN82_08240 [Bacteroidetes bacterium]|nr:MAG: hypothetical protein EPN82_08240 [Bacteroidota bacterium]
MRITSVDIPKSPDNNDGLEHIKMDRLGPIVLLAGKNGSGKTRILNKIFSTLKAKPNKNLVNNSKLQMQNIQKNISQFSSNNENLKSKLLNQTNQTQIDNLNRAINDNQLRIENSNKQILDHEKVIYYKTIISSEISDHYTSVHFVPKNLTLTDCNQLNKHELLRSASNYDKIGIENIHTGTSAKIQIIQNSWHEATHQFSSISEIDKKNAIENYEKLKYLIKIFLNTEIDRDKNGEPTLFGLPMSRANLSEGQIVLIQFCLLIYSQETALKDLILVMDEPENHLHPSVIIELLNRIQKFVSNGQIWIATHSIPLLAHFDPSLIWYVENNKISYAGKIPEKVLSSLLGDENEIAKLQDFISLPAQYATSNYAFECLFEPKTIMTGSNDIQSYQIREELIKLTKEGKLRVLDYGAGKGRLLSNIFDLEPTEKDKLIENLDYIAYDKFDKDKEQCENSISKAYSICEKRYYNNMQNLLSDYDKNSFNVVIMCDVFHEIDPKDWFNLFKEDGTITSLLADDGLLLLVEDYQMPIGEKAYQNGFIVLDRPQLKELFKITEKDKDFITHDKYGDGRLKSHLIPKNYLIRIDSDSRSESLKSLCKYSKENVKEIRNKGTDYKIGKIHGFWIQQLVNSELSLEELTVK